MPRVLLLVPTTTYRAEAFVRAAQAQRVDVTVASETPSTLAEENPSELITLDFSRPDACVEKMRTFARDHPIHAVIAVDDQTTLAGSAIAGALDLPHNPAAAVYAARNKYRMRTLLRNAGVPVPDFKLLPTRTNPEIAAGEASFPCVLKPIMMAASRGVIRANTAGDFVKAFHRITALLESPNTQDDEQARNHILVESYVPGVEVAVEGILTRGNLDIVAIFDKPDPLEGPYFPETIYVTPSRLASEIQDRIASITGDAVRALGLEHGPVHAEVRGEGDELYFLEIAARSIGGHCSRALRFEGDLSLEEVIIRHALGTDRDIPPREPRASGVMMLQAMRTGYLKAVRGLEAVRDLPRIDDVLISAHLDQLLAPLPEGFLYIGFVFAHADTAEAVEAALRRAYDGLDIVISPQR